MERYKVDIIMGFYNNEIKLINTPIEQNDFNYIVSTKVCDALQTVEEQEVLEELGVLLREGLLPAYPSLISKVNNIKEAKEIVEPKELSELLEPLVCDNEKADMGLDVWFFNVFHSVCSFENYEPLPEDLVCIVGENYKYRERNLNYFINILKYYKIPVVEGGTLEQLKDCVKTLIIRYMIQECSLSKFLIEVLDVKPSTDNVLFISNLLGEEYEYISQLVCRVQQLPIMKGVKTKSVQQEFEIYENVQTTNLGEFIDKYGIHTGDTVESREKYFTEFYTLDIPEYVIGLERPEYLYFFVVEIYVLFGSDTVKRFGFDKIAYSLKQTLLYGLKKSTEVPSVLSKYYKSRREAGFRLLKWLFSDYKKYLNTIALDCGTPLKTYINIPEVSVPETNMSKIKDICLNSCVLLYTDLQTCLVNGVALKSLLDKLPKSTHKYIDVLLEEVTDVQVGSERYKRSLKKCVTGIIEEFITVSLDR